MAKLLGYLDLSYFCYHLLTLYYGRLERIKGLNASTYLKLATVVWVLNTISISLTGLAMLSLEGRECDLFENIGFGSVLCPGTLAIGATFVLMSGFWSERVRRLAREQNDKSN